MVITRKHETQLSILTLSKRFDITARKEFLAAIKAVKETNPKKIILDLAGVDFLDSSAFGILMMAYKDLAAVNIRLVIAKAQGTIRETLKLMKTQELIPMVNSLDEARRV